MVEARSRLSGRQLLDATLQITRGTEVTEVLERLLDAACHLMSAEHAAVGVLGQGHLVRFMHSGMDADTIARVVDLQSGHGSGEDSGSTCGHHRAVGPLLGAPIWAHGEVLGTLYLTKRQDGAAFSVEDQELAAALAAAAGVAIEKAALVAEAQRRQAWQSATVNLTTRLLSGEDPRTTLSVLAGDAMRLGAAAAAAIIVPAEDPALLRVAAGAGLLDPRAVGEFTPAEGSLSQLALARGATVVVDDSGAEDPWTDEAAADAPGAGAPGAGAPGAGAPGADAPGAAPRTLSCAAPAPGIGPAVAVPLATETVHGVLLVARTKEEHAFQPLDVEMIVSFAGHANLALTLADARRRRELERLVEDRERIATHLSEHAMQALLGISTTVHGLTARMRSPEDAQRLTDQADRLDTVLREMQQAIFGLLPR